uniref:Uncharacterized protein n=1 Tax=Gasterosteus aculeatus TaxID=69293 RepID=G3NCP8_GASAC
LAGSETQTVIVQSETRACSLLAHRPRSIGVILRVLNGSSSVLVFVGCSNCDPATWPNGSVMVAKRTRRAFIFGGGGKASGWIAPGWRSGRMFSLSLVSQSRIYL